MMLHKWICDVWFNKFFIVSDCCLKFFFVHAIPALKQGSCSMVVTENLSCGPHYSIERQLCLSLDKTETRGFFLKTWCDWPQQSVCHGCWCNRYKGGAKPQHGEAERCGGWILHPRVCDPAQGWFDSPQRWHIPSRGCCKGRIPPACPWKNWPPLECVNIGQGTLT